MSSRLKIQGSKNVITLDVAPNALEIKGNNNVICVNRPPPITDSQSAHAGPVDVAGSSSEPAVPVDAAGAGAAEVPRRLALRDIEKLKQRPRRRAQPYPALPAPGKGGLLAIKDRE